jgi:hypothetical protein
MPGSFYIGMQTGIHEFVNAVAPVLRIEPNPARGIVRFDADHPPGDVVVYDPIGRIIMTARLNHRSGTLDLSKLPPGVYFLKSKGLGGSVTKLILIR